MDTAYKPGGPSRYRLSPSGPMTPATTELTAVSTPGDNTAKLGAPWSPSNPLFWFGAVALVTFGLAAFSTSVRVGPAKVSLSAGK